MKFDLLYWPMVQIKCRMPINILGGLRLSENKILLHLLEEGDQSSPWSEHGLKPLG